MFHRMDRAGFFKGLKVELLEGQIVVIAAMDAEHRKPLVELNRAIVKLLPQDLVLQPQCPIASDDENEPEPDLAVVVDDPDATDNPTTALLAIEVANSSVRDDLNRKARIYARAGIPEYWVIDVKKRELVVHRNPSGEKYKSVKRLTDLSEVKSSAVPELVLDLRKIFVKK
ncbi:MAG: Uma2 family endonuclease [Archangium sp.]